MILQRDRIPYDEPLLVAETLPPTVLELDEPLARQHTPISAELAIQRDGEGLLVTGRLATTLRVRCGRCAEWIDWPIAVPNFTVHLDPPLPDIIDLTSQVREDILLDLPVAAACRLDAEERCPVSGISYPTASEPPVPIRAGDPWQVLDQVKIKE